MSASLIEQGSDAWKAMRCGKVTGSRIADIVRKTRTGVSATRQTYLGQLVAERLTNTVRDGFKSPSMKWGNDAEPEARLTYSIMMGETIEQIAFVDHPRVAMSGASPDGLVGERGLVEIKCPDVDTHIGYLLGDAIPADYITQMQWQMACTERDWCDWVSFDPRMPEDMRLEVRRVERDDVMIAELEHQVMKFLAEVEDTIERLVAKFRSEAA